ncbi:MAG: DUF5939 domain-containing protein, partial [bacterium]|nr:DUF5939 domain-containing protein [bacterium]
MKSFRYEWRWRAEATPEQLWGLLADTNRTNRDAGLPVVSETATVAHAPQNSSPPPLPAGTRRLGFTSLGVHVAWDEQPYEWIYPQRFSVLRTYLSGPWDQIIVRGELVPLDSGRTEFIYSLDVLPRGRLGALISAYQLGRISARAFDRTFRNFIALAQQDAPEVASGAVLPSIDSARLTQLEAQLATATDRKLAAWLAGYIGTSDDSLLTHMRPYTFSRHTNITRSEALALFFHATSVGLLDLQWDLLCPRCRGAKQTQLALADVTATVHCDACRIDFTADLPAQIELTFRPNAAVRRVELHEYCIGSPQRTPHIVMQQIVSAGESRDIPISLAPGSYRLRTFAAEGEGGIPGEVAVDAASDGDTRTTFSATNQRWDATAARIHTNATLTLSNNTGMRQVLLLERTQWRDDALTAAEATASPLFRDMFASELLRPGESISVGTLTV